MKLTIHCRRLKLPLSHQQDTASDSPDETAEWSPETQRLSNIVGQLRLAYRAAAQTMHSGSGNRVRSLITLI
jgi:hypothetical protein